MMILTSSQFMIYFDCSTGASCDRCTPRPTAVDALCQAHRPYDSVDSVVDSNTQDDTAESLGTPTPESITRAAASTSDDNKSRAKRKSYLQTTEVEADAGTEIKCIFFIVGPKKQKCSIPLYPTLGVAYNEQVVTGDLKDVGKDSPWLCEAIRKITSNNTRDKVANIVKELQA